MKRRHQFSVKNLYRQTKRLFFKKLPKLLTQRKIQSTSLYLSIEEKYKLWLANNGPNPLITENQKKSVNKLTISPLLSIITPLHSPNLDQLEELIDSLFAQTHPHWEMCLAGVMPETTSFGERIWQIIGTDPRIYLKHLDDNLGISGNTNAAVSIAQGDYLAFVDQDDILSPDALFEIVNALNVDPAIDMLYSDHDILSHDGNSRFSPLFKPDWSPEILLSANYVTHLSVMRKSVFHALGGLDPAMDGAQDLDLMLRLSEGSYMVRHIPRILYHWRESPGSTALDFANKPYTMDAQLRAIKAHLERLSLSGVSVDQRETGYIHVKWKVNPLPRVSIIIPSRGANWWLRTCLRTILQLTDYPDYEILVVNNGPKRPEEIAYYRRIQRDERVKVLHYDQPFNCSAVNNWGAQHATGEMLLFLNDDTEVIHTDWLREMVMWASRKEIGAVGVQLLYYDRTIQHAGVIVGLTGFAGHLFQHVRPHTWTIFGLPMWYRDYLAVTGACLMIRRKVLEEVGGWPEDLSLCGNDVVLGMRINQAGYRVVYDPFVRLYHHESATHKGNIPAADFRTSYLYYREVLEAGDPFFSPNLSLWSTLPQVRQKDDPTALQFVREYLERLAL
jgi:GT2 family glycosyltransferase